MSEELTVLERQNETINELENKLEAFEREKEDAQYTEDWKWRHIRQLTEKENLDLPLPRLEVRYREPSRNNVICDYGLVIRHLLGHIDFIPFSSTRMGCSGNDKDFCKKLETPFRDGAHITAEMQALKLRGFVVYDDQHREIYLLED